MTKDEALDLALEACPFCGGEAEYQKENVRSGYGEYERNETYHTIRCKKCGSSSKRVHQKHLIDFTKYTVRDFRENPILRAKVEDDYDAYCEQSKQLAIDAWGLRTAIEQAEKQEPVATLWQHGETGRTRVTMPGDITDCDAQWFRAADLYTTPPAAPVQEPVAWRFTGIGGFKRFVTDAQYKSFTPETKVWYEPFKCANYTTPPAAQRQWVGLTDEERGQAINANFGNGLWHMAKDIEAKLKEKNDI